MRYTEKEYDFKFDSVHDFIRILFSTTFLAPFRFFNEMSKKVLFLGKKSIKELIKTAIIIAGILLLGEVGYQLFFSQLSFFTGSIPLIAVVLALGILLFMSHKVDSLDIEGLDIFEETGVPVQEPINRPVFEEVPNNVGYKPDFDKSIPITEEFMGTASDAVINNGFVNTTASDAVINNDDEFEDSTMFTTPVSTDIEERLKGYDAIMNDSNTAKAVSGDITDIDDLAKLFGLNDESFDVLDDITNSINPGDLTSQFEDTTRALLGNKYESEKASFEQMADGFEKVIASTTKAAIGDQLEEIEDEEGFSDIDDFDFNAFILG